MREALLTVKNLKTAFQVKGGEVQAVRGISFQLNRGEILGLVGESGSGKSVACFSLLRVLPENGGLTSGGIALAGQELTALSEAQMRRIRGKEISMIFQDPMTSLSPLMTVGRQIEEAYRQYHPSSSPREARLEALELLRRVHIPDPLLRYRAYPHELSGGMRQRVMIAMAISCNPRILIADEPTTALDVTIQAQILLLLKEMREVLNLSVIFITHDLGVVAGFCDRVIVMYGGLIMEEGGVGELFYETSHPYTLGLLASLPRQDQVRSEPLKPIPGSPPNRLSPPPGCPFSPRCPWVRKICLARPPDFRLLSPTHRSACHLLSPGAPKTNNPFAKEAP